MLERFLRANHLNAFLICLDYNNELLRYCKTYRKSNPYGLYIFDTPMTAVLERTNSVYVNTEGHVDDFRKLKT